MQDFNTSKKKFAVWKDIQYGFAYGSIEQAKGKEIVSLCDSHEEARITWKFYYYSQG